MAAQPQSTHIYEGADGSRPFIEWMDSLRDIQAKATVLARLERLRLGLFGDCKAVGSGVLELRVDVGPGYRVYFARDGAQLVLLLVGGRKATQKKDILSAKAYWLDYKKRRN